MERIEESVDHRPKSWRSLRNWKPTNRGRRRMPRLRMEAASPEPRRRHRDRCYAHCVGYPLRSRSDATCDKPRVGFEGSGGA
jgi:hypothetical protein